MITVKVLDYGAEGDFPSITYFNEDQIEEILEFSKIKREDLEGYIRQVKNLDKDELIMAINLDKPLGDKRVVRGDT